MFPILRFSVRIAALAASSSLAYSLPALQDVSVPADVPTIQAGIDAVGPGGTVFVSPGVYAESLLIDPGGALGPARGQTSMTIESSAPGVIVTWIVGNHGQPASLVESGRLQDYNLAAVGVADLTLRGLTFDGMDDIIGGAASMAILFQDSSGRVEHGVIHGYRDSPTSGIQNGLGIVVEGSASVVSIDSVSFFDIQKSHVVGRGGSQTDLTGCTFTGRGVTGSIAQNGVQFSGPSPGPDARGSVVGCTFTGFWYDGGTFTSTGVLAFDSGPSIRIDANTFLDCQTAVFDTGNMGKVTTRIRNNHIEEVTPFAGGILPRGIVVQDGNQNNGFLIHGNVLRNVAGPGVDLSAGGGTVSNNWFDGNGTSNGKNANDGRFSNQNNTWNNNTWSDLAANPLGPSAYLVPGSAGAIDSDPQSGDKTLLYGSLNPAGSLTVLTPPKLGAVFSVGIDNPLGTQAPGAMGFFAASLAPDPNFPSGTLLHGWGMNGGAGELLIDLAGPNPVLLGTPWGGPGVPSVVSMLVPNDPDLVGQLWYGQGMLLDPTTPGFQRGLTEAVQLTLGF